MNIPVRLWKGLSKDDRKKILSRSEIDISSVKNSVSDIIEEVRRDGDAAVRRRTLEFDHVDLKGRPIEVSEEEFADAEGQISDQVKSALRYSIDNVKAFHETQVHDPMSFCEIRPGLFAGERFSPIQSAGLYVPMGRGSFPSMLYMLAVPAKIAGVPSISVVTPPGADGGVDPACLFTARMCGVDHVYRVGGAQAIAALAFGTEEIPRVQKIMGPGSMYVTAAKQLLYGMVDVGLPAGPSESMILADSTADAWRVSLDLMVEAEHGSDSSAVLVTCSAELAARVSSILPDLIHDLPEPRKTFVQDVFSIYGGIILTETFSEAVSVVNEYAPEHLQIRVSDPFSVLGSIVNAGEILLGEHIPFSMANYATGVNAVLPTGGNAKTWSPVSVRDFTKASSVVYASEKAYAEAKEHVVALSDYEGFTTHANALRLREDDPDK